MNSNFKRNQEIIHHYLKGEKLRWIAAEYHIGVNTIYKLVKENNLSPRANDIEYIRIRNACIIRDRYGFGMRIKVIADKYKLTVSMVNRIIRKWKDSHGAAFDKI